LTEILGHFRVLSGNCFTFWYEAFRLGLSSIVAGSLTAIYVFNGVIGFKALKFPGWILKAGLIVLIYYFHRDDFHLLPYGLNMLACAAAIALFILSNLFYRSDFIFRFLNNRSVVYVGTLSYGIYIWQQLFMKEFPWKNAFPYSGSMLFNLLLLAIVVLLSYYLVERPFLKLKEATHLGLPGDPAVLQLP